MKRILGGALCAAVAALAGCVDSSINNAATRPIELARYLPAKTTFIQTVDVTRAREELNLPQDANAAPTNDRPGRPNSALSRLVEVTSQAFPLIALAEQESFSPRGASPLDGTLIRSAANAPGPEAGPLTIVSTAESFEDIASKLELTGYERDGALYAARPRAPGGAAPIVADAGDGRIVFADERKAANDVLDRIAEDAEAGPVAEAIQAVNGSVRVAFAAERGTASCVTEFAASQTAPGTRAVLALEIEGEKPDPERFNPRVFTGIEAGTPTVLVDALIVPFSIRKPPRNDPPDPIFQLLTEPPGPQTTRIREGDYIPALPALPPFKAYECP